MRADNVNNSLHDLRLPLRPRFLQTNGFLRNVYTAFYRFAGDKSFFGQDEKNQHDKDNRSRSSFHHPESNNPFKSSQGRLTVERWASNVEYKSICSQGYAYLTNSLLLVLTFLLCTRCRITSTSTFRFQIPCSISDTVATKSSYFFKLLLRVIFARLARINVPPEITTPYTALDMTSTRERWRKKLLDIKNLRMYLSFKWDSNHT